MTRASRTGRAPTRAMVALTVWLAIFALSLVRIDFLNDHFDRIARGRQVLVYGDQPFADFRDPGYFLTAYVSAAAQALSRGGLLGEAVVSSAAIAASGVLTLWLAESASGSLLIGLIAACFTIVVSPRYYDYDKVLFYTAGLALAWRSVDSPSRGPLVAAGAVTAVAGLFRYDNGLFVMVACVTAIVACRIRTPSRLASDGALYVGSVLAVVAPALVFIQFTATLPEALRQVAEYAATEGERSELFRLPRLTWDRVSVLYLLIVGMVPAALLNLGWRWWAPDGRRPFPAAKMLAATLLLACVAVFILRDQVTARIGAAAPLAAVLAAAIAGLWRHGARDAMGSSHDRPHRHPALVALAAIVGVVIVLAAQFGVGRLGQAPAVVGRRLRALGSAWGPPFSDTPHYPGMPRVPGLVEYLKACTRPDDRVLVTWFAPEIYFFAQRGFAGGMPVVLGSHWSSDVDQRRTIAQIESQSVPVILVQTESGGFDKTFPRLAAYLNDRYRDAGATRFGDATSGSVASRVLIRRELGDLPTDPRWALPCPSRR